MDVTSEVQRLADVEAIKRLKARYFRCVDLKLWDQLLELLAPNVSVVVGRAGRPPAVAEGAREYVELVRGRLAGARTVHHGHCAEVEITGPRSATGIWAMTDYVDQPDERILREAGLAPGAFVGYGHYYDKFARETDGEWRIEALELRRIRVDPAPRP